MRAVDLIRQKRDGGVLDRAAIDCVRRRRHRRHASRLPDVRAPDGHRAARDDAGGDRRADRRDGPVGRPRRPIRACRCRDAGRQAQHRRRRRQDVARPGAARGRLRRARADDVGPRPRPHRRHARQARGHSRVSHRRCRSRSCGSASPTIGCALIGQTSRDRAGRPEALRAARRHRHGREHPAHLARRS